jgi:pimeloyl-ACP methyl ester carboxylesterase
MIRGYIDAPDGQQLHYRVAGARGGTPLVLIHQSPSSGAMWDPIMPKLAQCGYFAVAPDLIGHGASDRTPKPPTLEDYASGVWNVVDMLGLDAIDVIGHHSGASIAIIMTTQQPARVRALALWGVPLMTPEREDSLYAESQQAARMAPNGRFAPMHGASLDVADQDGSAFVDLIDGFLRGCGAHSSR